MFRKTPSKIGTAVPERLRNRGCSSLLACQLGPLIHSELFVTTHVVTNTDSKRQHFERLKGRRVSKGHRLGKVSKVGIVDWLVGSGLVGWRKVC